MFETYTTIECCSCGIRFGVPPAWEKDKRNSKKGFYCPNGHDLTFTGQTEADKLRRERDRLKQNAAFLQDEINMKDRQLAAQKGQVTKLKNRAKNGVCPCCNRSFENLQRHMATKHPDFAVKETA